MPHKVLIHYKVEKLTIRWRSLADFTLTKEPKLPSPVIEQIYTMWTAMIHREEHNIPSKFISANCAHLNLIVRKHQAKPNQGTFVTIFKVPKVNKRLRNTSILKDDKEICQINEMWIIKDITWNNWWILNRVWKFNVNDILVFFFF